MTPIPPEHDAPFSSDEINRFISVLHLSEDLCLAAIREQHKGAAIVGYYAVEQLERQSAQCCQRLDHRNSDILHRLATRAEQRCRVAFVSAFCGFPYDYWPWSTAEP